MRPIEYVGIVLPLPGCLHVIAEYQRGGRGLSVVRFRSDDPLSVTRREARITCGPLSVATSVLSVQGYPFRPFVTVHT